MRTSSAKAKGRRKQQEVASALRAFLAMPETDIKSLPMGSQGVDIWMSEAALNKLPVSVEVKCQEALNIWSALAQSETNSLDGTIPCVAFSRNRSETYVALKLEDFFHLLEIYRVSKTATKKTAKND